MEQFLPAEVISEIVQRRMSPERKITRLAVVSGERLLPILELTDKGFVIEADGLPHLRGYVDIMRIDERIGRRLVVCVWAKDGLVGYEFKHDGAARDVAVDYVKPDHRGLLNAPAE